MRPLAELLLLLFFLLPLGVLLAHFDGVHLPPAHDVLPFLNSAFLQAILSATTSSIFGILLGIGILFLRSESPRQTFEVFFLIPGLMPGIFIVLSILQIYSVLDAYPMGYWGVVSANVAMSFGLVGVFLARAFREKVGGFAELAHIEGATPLRTLRTLAPLMWRDLASMFLAVFIFSFLGFSIPLALGGLQAATLEVQIYRKVIAEGAVAEALALSLLQFAFIALCAQLIPLRSGKRKITSVNLSFLGSPLLLFVGFFLTAAIMLAPMSEFFAGASAVFHNRALTQLLLRGSLATLIVAFMAGFFTLALGAVMVYLWPPLFINRFFFSYSAPSAVLIGFGFFLLGYHVDDFAPQVAFLGVILGVFFWPSLYRVGFYNSAAGLASQIEVAKQMGAEAGEIFRMVTWPQMRGPVCGMAALAALWGAGDFGISSMLAVDDSTLSLLVKNLISRYHLPEATFILWILVTLAALAALTFLGFYRVTNRRSSLPA
jgi:ABC-type Fe3+ transport system permease subunit